MWDVLLLSRSVRGPRQPSSLVSVSSPHVARDGDVLPISRCEPRVYERSDGISRLRLPMTSSYFEVYILRRYPSMLFLIVAHAAQSQILVPTMIGAMQLLQLALGPMSTTKGNTKGFTRTLLPGTYFICAYVTGNGKRQPERTLSVLRQRF